MLHGVNLIHISRSILSNTSRTFRRVETAQHQKINL